MAKQRVTDKQREKRKYWEQHIEQWSRIELTQVEYCRRHKLSVKSFTYWKGRFGQKSSVSFVPVQVKPETVTAAGISSALIVSKDGYRIEINEGFNPAALAEVLKAIRKLQC